MYIMRSEIMKEWVETKREMREKETKRNTE